MSRFMSALLAKEKSAVKTVLTNLEEASGETSIDAKMLSEIVVSSKAKLKQLGLDTEDSAPEEVYVSLINLVKLHDSYLAKALGGSDPSDTTDMLPRITKFTNNVASKKQIWGIKHVVAKRLIKDLPPKTLMKKLGYRSVDSMLKRESIDDLFAGIKVIEDQEYITKLFSSFAKLKPSDFESRKMSVRRLSKKWDKITNNYVKENRNNIIELKSLGTVIVLSMPVQNLKGATITLLPLILHKLNDIHVYSSFIKFEQVQHNFGQILSDTLQDKPISNVNMAGLDISWNIVREHFGKLAETGMSEIFGPHIQSADLEKKSVEESLYKLEPALHFWFGCNNLGLAYEGVVISFNLLDVATSYINNLDFGSNSTKYLSESLWDELLTRYLDQEPLHDQVVQQLDTQDSSSEFGEQISGLGIA